MEQTEETEAIRSKLHEVLEELPLTRWSERTIFDTLTQWAEDHGRNPTVSSLKQKGMPPHPVIKLRFGVNAKEFLDEHFPQEEKAPEYWKALFISEYKRMGKPIAEEYNKGRKEGTLSWATVAKLYEIDRWSRWLAFCKLEPKHAPPPKKSKKKFVHKMKVQIQAHFLDQVVELWDKDKIKEFFPNLTAEVVPCIRTDTREVEEVLEGIRRVRAEFAMER